MTLSSYHDESETILIGRKTWGWTFGLGLNDNDTFEALNDRFSGIKMEPPFGQAQTRDWALLRATFYAVKWADAGFPKLAVVGHKYAAALACTAAHSAADVRLPWDAFVLSVPNGLIAASPSSSYVQLRCWKMLDNFFLELIADGDRAPMLVSTKRSFEEVLYCDRWIDGEQDLLLGEDVCTGNEGDDRVMRVAQRILVGALYTLQHTVDWTDRDGALKQRRRDPRTGPPKHRTVVIGRPIQTDMRPALSRALGGEGPLPTVQSLVRGHYKRQPVGPGGRDRKVIWLEPYWRGPEDAPIAFRPHVVSQPE